MILTKDILTILDRNLTEDIVVKTEALIVSFEIQEKSFLLLYGRI